MKIISGILILATAYLGFTHGWPAVTNNLKPEQTQMFTDLGFNKTTTLIVGLLSLAGGILVLIPQTFFIGNVLNAAIILLIMALALRVGNIKTALIEIPFLLIPLVLIYLGHPLKK
jgi:uncharacterized membrane protein YphA (DoxX/SURF4 family)